MVRASSIPRIAATGGDGAAEAPSRRRTRSHTTMNREGNAAAATDGTTRRKARRTTKKREESTGVCNDAADGSDHHHHHARPGQKCARCGLVHKPGLPFRRRNPAPVGDESGSLEAIHEEEPTPPTVEHMCPNASASPVPSGRTLTVVPSWRDSASDLVPTEASVGPLLGSAALRPPDEKLPDEGDPAEAEIPVAPTTASSSSSSTHGSPSPVEPTPLIPHHQRQGENPPSANGSPHDFATDDSDSCATRPTPQQLPSAGTPPIGGARSISFVSRRSTLSDSWFSHSFAAAPSGLPPLIPTPKHSTRPGALDPLVSPPRTEETTSSPTPRAAAFLTDLLLSNPSNLTSPTNETPFADLPPLSSPCEVPTPKRYLELDPIPQRLSDLAEPRLKTRKKVEEDARAAVERQRNEDRRTAFLKKLRDGVIVPTERVVQLSEPRPPPAPPIDVLIARQKEEQALDAMRLKDKAVARRLRAAAAERRTLIDQALAAEQDRLVGRFTEHQQQCGAQPPSISAAKHRPVSPTVEPEVRLLLEDPDVVAMCTVLTSLPTTLPSSPPPPQPASTPQPTVTAPPTTGVTSDGTVYVAGYRTPQPHDTSTKTFRPTGWKGGVDGGGARKGARLPPMR